VGATTRRTRGAGPARLGLGVATALAMAFSLSGLALANELPQGASGTSPLLVSATALAPRSSRTPPPTPPELALGRVPSSGHRRSQVSEPLYRLPVARHLIDRSELGRPHHDYPAWDLPVPVGTRVVAVRAGRVQEITDSGSCGNGVVVVSPDDYTYTYCHGSKVLVQAGSKAAGGRLLMLSGDSGHSKGPHLHLQIESPTGVLLCPQSLVTSWFNGGQKGPATAISTGCFYITRRHPHRHRTTRGRWGSQQGRTSGGSGKAGSGSGATRPASSPAKPSPQPSLTPTPRPTASATPTPLPTPSPSLT
jgi:murein DD-endopeptidase MepM/ murein hydrolase activator NlpD